MNTRHLLLYHHLYRLGLNGNTSSVSLIPPSFISGYNNVQYFFKSPFSSFNCTSITWNSKSYVRDKGHIHTPGSPFHLKQYKRFDFPSVPWSDRLLSRWPYSTPTFQSIPVRVPTGKDTNFLRPERGFILSSHYFPKFDSLLYKIFLTRLENTPLI